MRLHPTFPEFQALADGATLVPVYAELLFDTETAVSAYAKLARPPFGFLLESVVGGERWARYTFLGTEPREVWRYRAGSRAVERWTKGTGWQGDRKSTRLNSSHEWISYAVFCLKKKKKHPMQS